MYVTLLSLLFFLLLCNGEQGRMTNYIPGLGACGVVFTSSDFVVAMNSRDYADSQSCFKMVNITYQDKSALAKVLDMCATCNIGGLDLTPGLFEHFADINMGSFTAEWTFVNDTNTSSSTTSSSSTVIVEGQLSSTDPQTATTALTNSATSVRPLPSQAPGIYISTRKLIGGIVGGVAGVLIVLMTVVWSLKRRYGHRSQERYNTMVAEPDPRASPLQIECTLETALMVPPHFRHIAKNLQRLNREEQASANPTASLRDSEISLSRQTLPSRNSVPTSMTQNSRSTLRSQVGKEANAGETRQRRESSEPPPPYHG